MKIRYIILFIFIVFAKCAFAQKDTLVYYLNNDGTSVSDPQQAAYRLIIYPEKWIKNDKVSEIKGIDLDKKLKFTGYSSNHGLPIMLQNIFTEYYPSGNKMRVRRFNGGYAEDIMEYYDDGKVKAESHRTKDGDMDDKEYYPNGQIKTEREPAGNNGLSEKNYYENGQLQLQRIPKGHGYYDEMEYNADGKLLRNLETNDLGRGVETLYYKNGTTKEVRNFLPQGAGEKIVAYYPNGKPYFTKESSDSENGPVTNYIECSDSTGKSLTQKGNGYWIEYSDDFSFKALQGKVVKRMPDSVWNRAYTATEGEYETFKQGKQIGMIAYGTNPSDTVNYDKAPEFPDGLNGFNNFLAKNVRYPAMARQQNITGRVIITFMVERDGSLTNVTVFREIGGGCGAEAARVIRSSPKWLPGTLKGVPVRVRYSVPVNFTISHEPIMMH